MERCSVWEGLRIEAGSYRDYLALASFHYRAGRPGVVRRVIVARWAEGREQVLAGVVVESMPVLSCRLRDLALAERYGCGGDRLAAARKVNAELRVISRLVVHPMFRGVGVGLALVRRILETASTPYVEALATMGRIHPVFERAGMRAYWPEDAGPAEARRHTTARPVYYLWSRESNSTKETRVPESAQGCHE